MNFSGEPAQFETEITDVILRTEDVKSVRFRRPKGFDYLSGQWAFVTVGSEVEQKTKPLSFSSSPTEDFLEFTKRLTGHEFSNAFAALEVGNTAIIRGPFGKLTLQENHGKICMLSGGIGITPLRSMIRYSTYMKPIDKHSPSRFQPLRGCTISFIDYFYEMRARYPNFEAIVTITRPGNGWK